MNTKNTEAQVKAQVIQAIEELKEYAISLGFDYPTEDISQATDAQLIDFLIDIQRYVAYEEGYEEGLDSSHRVSH